MRAHTRIGMLGLVASAVALAMATPVAAQGGANSEDPALLATCLDLVGGDVGELFPRYEPIVDAVDSSAVDTEGMPQVAACFESLSLDELYLIHESGEATEAYLALSDEYGSDWDEWVDLWARHNPDTRTAALITDTGGGSSSTGLVVGIVIAVVGLAVGGGLAIRARAQARDALAELEAFEAEAARPKEFRMDRT